MPHVQVDVQGAGELLVGSVERILGAVVVGVDVLFFRHHFWGRLIVNVGMVFGAIYLRFLKRP